MPKGGEIRNPWYPPVENLRFHDAPKEPALNKPEPEVKAEPLVIPEDVVPQDEPDWNELVGIANRVARNLIKDVEWREVLPLLKVILDESDALTVLRLLETSVHVEVRAQK
jgi:hypothetical protein